MHKNHVFCQPPVENCFEESGVKCYFVIIAVSPPWTDCPRKIEYEYFWLRKERDFWFELLEFSKNRLFVKSVFNCI